MNDHTPPPPDPAAQPADRSAQRLDERDAPAEPFALFDRWFADAHATEPEAEAVALATATADGAPSVRWVLLRGWNERGFVFYTSYESRKGGELAANPRAALAFYWPLAGRQVRIEGAVSRVTDAESDAYFASRPVGSRLSAAASPQSRVVADRRELERRVEVLVERYRHDHTTIPRPPHWGGFRLAPSSIEFWLSRPHRLHDRLRYVRDGGGWRIERLAP